MLLFRGKKFKIKHWEPAPKGFTGYVLFGYSGWGADIPHPLRKKINVYNRIGEVIGTAVFVGKYPKPYPKYSES